jgi:formate hydrogenlyase subunit 6/NADH:ubiquinone oxidoreductase subunit I
MLPRILKKDSFEGFVKLLMGRYRVFAPVPKGPQYAFERIEGPSDIGAIRMDYTQTILPPKKILMPQYDKLLSFSGRGPEGVKAEVASEPTAILGVHPHDLHGLATTDGAMCQAPLDPYYKARRDKALLIGVNIDSYINEHQFMADMGTLDPPEGGFDLFLTDLGDRYYVEIGSEAGSRLATEADCSAALGEDHADKQAYDARKADNCKKRLPYDVRYLPELLDGSYDSLLWDAVAKRCFSCGTCTNVCPTCYCFDVQDKPDLNGSSGVRQRRWDSCQLEPFAEVAGGENFREARSSRLRHRIFRKGKFILERTGKIGCVGCGRCSLHCVAKISILETLQQIADQSVALDA